jgi:queuine tRNA-ribosyltransferase
MGWGRPILTDSGGFQVVSLGDLNAIDDDGVTFRSHHDGSSHRFTPETSIAIQEALGADVAVAFDQPVPPSSTDPRDVAIATERTHRWAERSLAPWRATALFGVIRRARPTCGGARALIVTSFVGLNISGSPGRDAGAAEVLDVVVPLLAGDSRVRYLMGLSPPGPLVAVDPGIDLLSVRGRCAMPRYGSGRRLNLRSSSYEDQPIGGLRLPRLPLHASLRHLFRAASCGSRLATV